MDTLLITGLLIAWLFAAYRIYGSYVEKKIMQADPSRATPACEMCDNVDYSPAKKLLLFGHHFSSIAGVHPPSAASRTANAARSRAVARTNDCKALGRSH